jgi:hypothetical protein
MGDQAGGGSAAVVYMSDGFPRWLGVRRARYGSASPASRVAARSLRDGLRPPLTPEPPRPLRAEARAGQGLPSWRAAHASDSTIATTSAGTDIAAFSRRSRGWGLARKWTWVAWSGRSGPIR